MYDEKIVFVNHCGSGYCKKFMYELLSLFGHMSLNKNKKTF